MMKPINKKEIHVYENIGEEINSDKKKLMDKTKDHFWNIYYTIFGRKRKFIFKDKSHNYFFHIYNATWRNERAIEIPIIFEILENSKGKNILELGNVTSHYHKINHDVVDKYEKGKRIINEDIIEFNTSKKYDLIISISTIEHIGWDESPKDPKKINLSIRKLQELLTAQGKIYLTFPLGYNPHLDELIEKKEIKFEEIHYLKRIDGKNMPSFLKNIPGYNNFWEQVNYEEVKNVTYDTPFPHANGIVIGVIKK